MYKIISIVFFAVTLVAALLIGFHVVDEQMTNGEADLREYFLQDFEVRVKLEADEHCVIVSENPVTVKRGEAAQFDIVFENNYKLDEEATPDRITVSEGKLTVADCRRNTTLKLSTTTIADYFDFSITPSDESLGTIYASSAAGKFVEGTEITVKATPKADQTFIGWSLGAPVLSGGRIVSYSQEYTFKLDGTTDIYPNFLTAGYSIIKYNLNGGVLAADGTTDIIYQQFKGNYRLNPNAIRNDGSIVKEGHTLLEFTENADGSGEFYTPGGIIPIKDGAIIELYAQWSEWTDPADFECTLDRTTGNYTITRYIGNLPTVSIPAEKDGIPITKIAASAFKRKTCSTLIIPSSVITVENNAFEYCTNLETLYISDNFTSFYDTAFKSCKAFKNLRLAACLAPTMQISESIAPRIDSIIHRDSNDKPLMIFVGGSSCMYGIKAHIIEEQLNYEYQVINAGTNASGCGLLYIEAFNHYLREGDIVVNVPEYGNIQMGKSEIVWRTLRATESCFNVFSYIDFSKYTGFFTAMTEFNTDTTARAGKPARSYDLNHGLTPRYCDLKQVYPSGNTIYSAIRPNSGSLTDDAIVNINTLIATLRSNGVKYYFGCAPICYYDAKGTKPTDKELEDFYKRAVENLQCPVISHPDDYLYNTLQYCNSSYHLDTENAGVHSLRVVADIKAQLESEK